MGIRGYTWVYVGIHGYLQNISYYIQVPALPRGGGAGNAASAQETPQSVPPQETKGVCPHEGAQDQGPSEADHTKYARGRAGGAHTYGGTKVSIACAKYNLTQTINTITILY